jgi:hypothetical protein
MSSKMSLTEAQMQLLMQFGDGEASGDDEARAVRLLAEHHQANNFVLAQARVGHAIRAAVTDVSSYPDLAGMVMQRLDLDARVQAPKIETVVEARPAAKVLQFSRATKWGVGVASSFAIAAGIALMIEQKPGQDSASFEASRGVEVQEVESSNPVSVFYLPAAINAKASSVVIWISDEPDAAVTVAPPSVPSVNPQ